jgi:hypothetical protein
LNLISEYNKERDKIIEEGWDEMIKKLDNLNIKYWIK